MAEREPPGAEVVDRDREVEVLEVLEGFERSLGVLDHGAFGDLDAERIGAQLPLRNRVREQGHEVGVRQLPRGEVERDLDRPDPTRLPLGRLARRLVQHPIADPQHQAALLGDRHEIGSREQASFGVVPSNQRLHSEDAPVPQRDLRLVVKLEAPGEDGGAKLAFHLHQAGGPRPHLLGEEDIA